jgi:hypothetical protein
MFVFEDELRFLFCLSEMVPLVPSRCDEADVVIGFRFLLTSFEGIMLPVVSVDDSVDEEDEAFSPLVADVFSPLPLMHDEAASAAVALLFDVRHSFISDLSSSSWATFLTTRLDVVRWKLPLDCCPLKMLVPMAESRSFISRLSSEEFTDRDEDLENY